MIFLEAVAAVGKSITSAVLGSSTPEKSGSRASSSKIGINDENQPDNDQSATSIIKKNQSREIQTVS
jgi:hypothetical protein